MPGESTIELLNTLFNKMSFIEEAAKTWLSVGKTIGLIGAYIYIFKKFANKILVGEAFGLQDFAYPMFIAFLLSVYTPVAKGIETIFVGNGFLSENSVMLASTFQKNRDDLIDQEKTYMVLSSKKNGSEEEAKAKYFAKAAKLGMAQNIGDNNNSEQNIEQVNKFSDTRSGDASSGTVGWILELVCSWLISVVGYICVIVIFFIAKLYLIFLYIFGPFSIGISLIPGFENSVSNWFQKYISYSLWVPVGNTIVKIFSGLSVDTHADINTQILFCVLMIFSFVSIPKITSNIISVSANQSGTRSMVQQGAKLAMKSKGIPI